MVKIAGDGWGLNQQPKFHSVAYDLLAMVISGGFSFMANRSRVNKK